MKVCQKACNSVQVTPVGKSCQQAATIADATYMRGNMRGNIWEKIYGRKYMGGNIWEET